VPTGGWHRRLGIGLLWLLRGAVLLLMAVVTVPWLVLLIVFGAGLAETCGRIRVKVHDATSRLVPLKQAGSVPADAASRGGHRIGHRGRAGFVCPVLPLGSAAGTETVASYRTGVVGSAEEQNRR
jgi:hypothetical protein